MKSVLVVNILASKIEKIPAQPQPVRVTACIVETDDSLKYLLNSDGRPRKITTVCEFTQENTN